MLKEKMIKMSGKWMGKFVQRGQEQWPPHCVGVLHQPKRPTAQRKNK